MLHKDTESADPGLHWLLPPYAWPLRYFDSAVTVVYLNEVNALLNFIVAPCINNIKHFIVQLMHTYYKILRLLK